MSLARESEPKRRTSMENRWSRRVAVAALAVLTAAAVLVPRAEAQDKKLKVALCLPGAISDKGFNAAAHAGLLRIRDELGHEIAFTESVQRTDFVTALRDYASRGYDVIIGHGSVRSEFTRTVTGADCTPPYCASSVSVCTPSSRKSSSIQKTPSASA